VNPSAEYEGGFTTSDDGAHFSVRVCEHETNVNLHVTQFGVSMGSASIYHQLSPAEARELMLALGMGADAAERTARERVAA
jgi:hypothetical protein